MLLLFLTSVLWTTGNATKPNFPLSCDTSGVFGTLSGGNAGLEGAMTSAFAVGTGVAGSFGALAATGLGFVDHMLDANGQETCEAETLKFMKHHFYTKAEVDKLVNNVYNVYYKNQLQEYWNDVDTALQMVRRDSARKDSKPDVYFTQMMDASANCIKNAKNIMNLANSHTTNFDLQFLLVVEAMEVAKLASALANTMFLEIGNNKRDQDNDFILSMLRAGDMVENGLLKVNNVFWQAIKKTQSRSLSELTFKSAYATDVFETSWWEPAPWPDPSTSTSGGRQGICHVEYEGRYVCDYSSKKGSPKGKIVDPEPSWWEVESFWDGDKYECNRIKRKHMRIGSTSRGVTKDNCGGWMKEEALYHYMMDDWYRYEYVFKNVWWVPNKAEGWRREYTHSLPHEVWNNENLEYNLEQISSQQGMDLADVLWIAMCEVANKYDKIDGGCEDGAFGESYPWGTNDETTFTHANRIDWRRRLSQQDLQEMSDLLDSHTMEELVEMEKEDPELLEKLRVAARMHMGATPPTRPTRPEVQSHDDCIDDNCEPLVWSLDCTSEGDCRQKYPELFTEETELDLADMLTHENALNSWYYGRMAGCFFIGAALVHFYKSSSGKKDQTVSVEYGLMNEI